MAWDRTRRWLYISQDDGTVQIYNPTPDFDFASKVMTIPCESYHIISYHIIAQHIAYQYEVMSNVV
jgi:hypothetical protein